MSETGEVARESPNPVGRYTRRLSDKILVAFHHACDQADYEVAEQLLRTLEVLVTRRSVRPDPNRRRSIDTLVAAHERLWSLRHSIDDPG